MFKVIPSNRYSPEYCTVLDSSEYGIPLFMQDISHLTFI